MTNILWRARATRKRQSMKLCISARRTSMGIGQCPFHCRRRIHSRHHHSTTQTATNHVKITIIITHDVRLFRLHFKFAVDVTPQGKLEFIFAERRYVKWLKTLSLFHVSAALLICLSLLNSVIHLMKIVICINTMIKCLDRLRTCKL